MDTAKRRYGIAYMESQTEQRVRALQTRDKHHRIPRAAATTTELPDGHFTTATNTYMRLKYTL